MVYLGKEAAIEKTKITTNATTATTAVTSANTSITTTATTKADPNKKKQQHLSVPQQQQQH